MQYQSAIGKPNAQTFIPFDLHNTECNQQAGRAIALLKICAHSIAFVQASSFFFRAHISAIVITAPNKKSTPTAQMLTRTPRM
jgi:hypothetical protein